MGIADEMFPIFHEQFIAHDKFDVMKFGRIENTLYHILEKLQRISPEWIPCSERLPEQGERVIVAIFGSDMIMPNEGETLQDAIERSRKEGYITVGFICSDGWYGADWCPLMVNPSYWMPKPDLPEPYEEKE